MDLRQLRYVDAVARRLNFTTAARDLHVAQPALSKSIANLEDELGTPLFVRTSRRVALTDAGVTFVARARQILVDVENLADEMADLGAGRRGHVRISTWFHLEPLLPALLRDFIAENAGIRVSVLELPTAQMVAALAHDELDFAVSVVPEGWEERSISYAPVRREQLVVVVPAADALSARSSISVRSLGGRALIAPLPGTALRAWFDRILMGSAVQPRVVVETNELAAALAYVSVGLGLAILPESVVPPIEAPLKSVKLAGVPAARVILAWHDSPYRAPAAQRALDYAKSHLSDAAG